MADGSSVGDHSTPQAASSLFLNHSAAEFFSGLSVECVRPDGTDSYWVYYNSWEDPLYNIAVPPGAPFPAGTVCKVTESIFPTPWNFKVFTDTDSDSTPVAGVSREIVLHAGDNFITFTSEDLRTPTADIYVDVTYTGDPVDTSRDFRLAWRCTIDRQGGTFTTANEVFSTSDTSFVLADRQIGETCDVTVSPYDYMGQIYQWTWTPTTTVEVTDQQDIGLSFIMDFFDPSLHGPSELEVTIEVDAPAGEDIDTRIEIQCPGAAQGVAALNYPADFTNGVATAQIYPTKSVSDCLVTEYYNVNGGLPAAWDQRVGGVCGNQKYVTIYGDSKSSITFSRTWIEPYVAQCGVPE